jgi:hypothetical protein
MGFNHFFPFFAFKFLRQTSGPNFFLGLSKKSRHL